MDKFLENHKPLKLSQDEVEYLNNSKIEFVTKTQSLPENWRVNVSQFIFWVIIPDMQGWFSIGKLISVIRHINRPKEGKNCMISIDSIPNHGKCVYIKIEGNFLNLITRIYKKQKTIASIILNVEMPNAFPSEDVHFHHCCST